MKRFILSAVFLLFAGSIAFSQITEVVTPVDVSEEYLAAVSEFITVTNLRQTNIEQINRILPMLKKAYEDVPEEFFDGFMARVKDAFNGREIDELFARVYVKYLSLEDLKGLTDFYKSPVGTKYASCMEGINNDISKAAGELGKKIAQDFLKDLLELYGENSE